MHFPFAWRWLVGTALVLGMSGCGGSPIDEGIPKNAEYKPPPMPDFMKGRNMAPKKIPKPGTAGTTTTAHVTK